MSDDHKHQKKTSRTEDDSVVSGASATDAKRGAFGKGRALSSKQLGAKRIQATASPTTAEDKEKMKRALLEGTEKKSKPKDAGESAEPVTSATSSARTSIQPLDEATQSALKKKNKKHEAEFSGDGTKSKSKRASRDFGVGDSGVDVVHSGSFSKLDDSQEVLADDHKSLKKKTRRSSSSLNNSVPALVPPPPALPPILSDRSAGEDVKPPASPPSLPPPLSPKGTNSSAVRSGSPSPASPRPTHGSPRLPSPHHSSSPRASPPRKLPPPVSPRAESPRTESPRAESPLPLPLDSPRAAKHTRDSSLPPPPPPEEDQSPSASHDADDNNMAPPPPPPDDDTVPPPPTEEEISVHMLPSSSSVSVAAPVSVSASTISIGNDSEESKDDDESSSNVKEGGKKKKKHIHTSIASTASTSAAVDDTSSSDSKSAPRERSSTKSRRDSVSMELTSLQLAGVPTYAPGSLSPISARGIMRTNRTPNGENVSSPRGQILIITPRGETHEPSPQSNRIALSLGGGTPDLHSLGPPSQRDSVDSSDERGITLSASMTEIPAPPPMPTIGLPPPPPPMPTRGASGVIRSESTIGAEVEPAKFRTRRVIPAVDAALRAWDTRASNFEHRLAMEVAHKTAPEELLEFPHDDLVLEMVHSQLEHYPPLTDAPQSVLDTYASYTTQLKQVHRQSQWYGTETSQKDRVKEYEMRQARMKVEAEKAAALQPPPPPPELKTSSLKVDRSGRRGSISKSGSATDQAGMARRASRAIKMTTASDSSPPPSEMVSSLPDLNEDDDSSAQESIEEQSADASDSASASASGTAASGEFSSNKKDKLTGSLKKPKSSADSLPPPTSSSPVPVSARGSMDYTRPASPDSRKSSSGTLRASMTNGGGSPSTPPKSDPRTRLSSRNLSGVAGSALDVGAGQATFALNPKMMSFDDKRRRSEAEKAEQDRKGIFEIFTPLSISSEATDHVQPVEPLRPKVDTRLMIHIKNIKLGIGYEEPFFISGAIYDIEKRLRLTETFYADFNDQNELLKSLLGQFYGPAEPESSCKRYLANLTYHSPSIYLILRVCTVLHGDIDDVADPYSGGSASSKDKQKLMDISRTSTSLLGKYHQGFGWAALQVFDDKYNFKLTDDNVVPLNKMKSPLSDQVLFDTLTSEEKVKPKVLDATISFGAFLCTRDKFQLMKCVDSSLVQWPAEQAPSLEVKNDKAGAILKSLVKPPTPVTDVVREVDVFELPTDKAAPYWCHVHNFFLYPQSFNLSSSKIKAKTVAAKAYLMKSDDGVEASALCSIFSRCADKNLTTHAITSTWWESTSAPLWDEFKIKLPHRITDSHHVLFVIYSVNVKVLSKKKEATNEPADMPIAYCWIRLHDHHLFMKDGEYTLPLLNIPQNGQIKGYLHSNQQDFIDPEKATFTVRTHLVSTVITQDDNLGQYFNLYDKMMASTDKMPSKDRKKMFDYITKAESKVVLKFFPVLFNQLFAQMCRTKSTTLQQSIFRVIVVLAQRVFDLTMVSGKLTVSDALYAYAIQYFDLPPDSLHNPADVIATNWVVLLETATGAKALEKAGMTPIAPLDEKLSSAEQSELQTLANFSLKDVSWFLFELIFKSLVLNMAVGNKSRRQITSPELQSAITKLVQFVDLHRRGIGSGFDHINRVLARTFIRLFSLTDRGFVLDLIHNHLVKLEGDHSATVFRFRFLQIVTDYEHYVQLNLPSYTPVDSLDVVPLKFWQHHYLAGLYLNELRSALLSGDDSKITRSKAIGRFRDLLWKHHLDDRYQALECRSRIAGMYFPLLMLLVEKVQLLIEKTQKDEMERTEWCLCGLWVMRYMNREAQLRHWWRGESTENLVNMFTFLRYCLDTFQNDEAMREDIMCLMSEVYDLFLDDLADELAIEGSKVMEAMSLSMIHLLRASKAEKLTLRLLQVVRTYVIKFKRPLFRYLASYTICGDLTFEVFSLCQSQPKRVMQNASSLLYLMLRTNNDEMGHFARMKLQSTLAVSRLVKMPGCNYDEIRNALEAMALYKDNERAASWDNQIREFINRHARIIRENIQLVSTGASFADRKAEIYYQISLEYVYSPDLRITWLGNLAQHHETNGNLLEAAICKVQIASLVSEYLTQVLGQRQTIKGIPDDASVFAHAFPTIKDEKAFSTIWLEGNTILSPSFSEDGFMKALNEAVDLFIRAEDFEAAAEVQLILANYFKENKRWEMLAPLGTAISANSQRLYETNRAQSRVPPNFYRVAFFGEGFEEDDGKEYLYRVNPAVRLADFTAALDQRYTEKFGAENYERIGNKPIEEYDIDITKKNYLQIVNCEIYFNYDQANAKDRLTYSDRSFDVKKFCFETPYSPEGGKLSEEVSKTWKRKIILSPAKTFPYILTRVPIRKKEVKILSPIESAVDLLLNIVTRFKEALNCTPPNTKTVQIILQGSVLTQVNAGPLAIIREFLGNASKYPEAEVAKIAEQVRGFVRRCKFGFALNATLIEKEPSLAPLHEEMSKAFKVLVAEAAKHIEI